MLYFLWFAFTLVTTQAPQCLPYTTRCASTCTIGGAFGSEITPSNCPVVNEFGYSRPRCDVCRSGFFCDVTSGRCHRNNELEGRLCASDANCQPYVIDRFATPLICFNNECVRPQEIKLWGDPCDSDNECSNQMVCFAGQCENLIGFCTRDGECAPDRQCNENNVCVPTQYNGPCLSDDNCPQSQVCNPTSNVCVNAFSLSGSCNGERARKIGCAGGTQCVPLSPSNRQCQAVGPPPTDCNPLLTFECDNANLCSCNDTSSVGTCTPKQFESNCALQWTTYLRCVEDEGCRAETEVAFFETCVHQKCLREFADVRACEDPLDFFTYSPECRLLERAESFRDSAAGLDNIFG